MTVRIADHLPADGDRAMRLALDHTMAEMRGSRILGIAADVRALQDQGRQICNLTVGDFSPAHFRVPDALTDQVQQAMAQGHTNYPPADGIPELKRAIADMYTRDLGLDYGAAGVCVGSGARPPIYAAWRLFTEPGDGSLSFLPSWNVGYYAHFCKTQHEFVRTTADTNFFPTADQVAAALPGKRLMYMNSPLNPTGTAVDEAVLRDIAQALVEENRAREAAGDKPCMWIYDQVYWRLTSGDTHHHNPVSLVPECAPYVVHVDAVSKWLAGTGLRVGWAVLPPYLQTKMKGFIGHMGAWAPRPIQQATAWLLDRPALVTDYLVGLQSAVDARLQRIYDAVQAMRSEGLPIDAIAPQGAIYLSLHVDLVGRGFGSNEEIRAWLLEDAGVAVVPFQAFDMPEDTGWFRMSVGAVGLEELDAALARLRTALKQRA